MNGRCYTVSGEMSFRILAARVSVLLIVGDSDVDEARPLLMTFCCPAGRNMAASVLVNMGWGYLCSGCFFQISSQGRAGLIFFFAGLEPMSSGYSGLVFNLGWTERTWPGYEG